MTQQEQKVSPEETIETLQQLLNIKNNRITELEFGIITEQRNSVKLKERIEELEKAESNGAVKDAGELVEVRD